MGIGIKLNFRRITKPKIISLFSGCGGLDLGFHAEGYETVWANDNNQWACNTFKRNFPKATVICKSVEEINPYKDKNIPSADIILGGFPCQDFSIIWKRPGLSGERGNLYKFFKMFVDAKKPYAFVAENVKGLLSANNYKAIKQIIEDFENILPGYLVKPQLYNFADYGVPQFRERVLIVGIRLDTGFEFIHPQPSHGPTTNRNYVTAGDALKDVEKVEHNNEHMKIKNRTRKIIDAIPKGGNFTDIPKDSDLYVKGMISHVYRRIDPDMPSKTIIAGGGGGTWGYHYPEPRALTNRERARLQSFPDNFIFEGSFTEVRRQIGNAVPPRGVRAIAKALLRLFHKNYQRKDLYILNEKYKNLPIKQRLAVDRESDLQQSLYESLYQ
ncbi:MAG: DNA cytosine methyltransferase [Promethearchaeota archaeon]